MSPCVAFRSCVILRRVCGKRPRIPIANMRSRRCVAIVAVVAIFACFPATAHAHAPGKALAIGAAVMCGLAGTVLGPLVSAILAFVLLRKHGWKKCILATFLMIIPVSVILSVSLYLLICVLAFATQLLSLPEELRQAKEASSYWPEWLERLAGGGISVVAVLMVSLIFAITVYIWTLSYGWLPSMLLKAKRHLLWLLPILSTAPLLWWLTTVTVHDEDISFTWMHPVLLGACPLAAYLAGLTIVGCSRVTGMLSAWRANSPDQTPHPSENGGPTLG